MMRSSPNALQPALDAPAIGQPRLLHDGEGIITGIEVWCGAEGWQPLRGIRWAASMNHPLTPCFHVASVVLVGVLPGRAR